MYLMDPIERAEARAEAQMDRITEGMPLGMFRCDCGHAGCFDDAQPISSDPYAMPVCAMCFDAWGRQ